MVTLQQGKTPTSLKDSKRFYINTYYSVGYGHPLAFRLGYRRGHVTSFKGGFVDGLRDEFGPWDRQSLQQDPSEEDSYDDDSSDANDCGIISREIHDSLLYESSDSSEDSDSSLKDALICLHNSSSEGSSDDDEESS